MENKNFKEELFREYELKRADALERKNIETKTAYEKCPDLKLIDDEINQLGFYSMRKIIKGESKKGEFLKSMNALIKKRNKIIKDNKINPDYNKPLYECKICNDTGYKSDNTLCECFTKRLTAVEYENSQLGKMLNDASFENFLLDFYEDKETAKEIKETALDFCKNFDNINYNLLFYGNTGLGKTFLSSIIAKSLLDSGKTVIYERATKMFSLYDDYKFKDYSLKEEVLKLYNCDLLVIDDLGSEFITKNSVSFLFDLINDRLINNKKIIINTNLEISQFSENYTVRLTSRLYESFKIFGFKGDDIRIKKLLKKWAFLLIFFICLRYYCC